MKKVDQPIIVEQVFDTSIDNLWSAITELAQMKLWFFENIESFKPIEGFKTQFVIKNEGRVFTHLWEITEVIPLKKITTNWTFNEYNGSSSVTFEIIEGNENVKLKLSAVVTEKFPNDIPEFKRESGVQGWNYFICGRLKDYLSNNK